MAADPLSFIHNGTTYRISAHIWQDHPIRVEQVTVERIRDTIIHPDFQEDENEYIRHYWKWFPELGSGNYIEVIVNSRQVIYFVSTAHPDRNFRKRIGPP